MKSNPDFDYPAFFRALADRTRLRLLNLMGEREVCVCYFVEVLGTSQPKISQHLAYLRDAGIVSSRRDGKWMHYRVCEPSEPRAKHMLHEVLEWLKGDSGMKKERERLDGICCAPKLPRRLRKAPLPQLTQITSLSAHDGEAR